MTIKELILIARIVLEFILKHIVNNLLATKTSTKEATITGETLTLDDILNINDDDVQFVPIFQKSSGNSRKRVRISRSKAPSTRGESVENPFADTEEEDNAGPSEDEAQEPEQDTKSVEKKTGQKRRERSSSSKVVFIREKKGSSAQEWQKLTPKSRQKAPVTNRSPSEDLVKIKEEKD